MINLSIRFEPLTEHGWSQGWLGLVLRRRQLGFALKLEMGTVLEPRGSGVPDARGRRAASPRVGGREKRNTMIIFCVRCEANQTSFLFRCFFPLASVSAGRFSVSARKPRSGVLARGVC